MGRLGCPALRAAPREAHPTLRAVALTFAHHRDRDAPFAQGTRAIFSESQREKCFLDPSPPGRARGFFKAPPTPVTKIGAGRTYFQAP